MGGDVICHYCRKRKHVCNECWQNTPRTLETEILSLWAEVESLKANRDQLENRVRLLEKQLDTAGTPLFKRIWFRVDGWPAWWKVAKKRAWRPWHRKGC